MTHTVGLTPYDHMTGNDLLFRIGSFVNSMCVSSSIKLCNQDKSSLGRY